MQVPDCYRHSPARLQPGYLSKFQVDTLFYIFYSMPNDEAQVLAADELRSRGWLFHKEFKVGSLLLLDQALHTSAALIVCAHGCVVEWTRPLVGALGPVCPTVRLNPTELSNICSLQDAR